MYIWWSPRCRPSQKPEAGGPPIEKALADFFRKSETHYRALIEMAADAIIAIDREGKIILMNPTAEETFGYGRDEAAGQSLAEQIVPEQSRELFHACLYGESRRRHWDGSQEKGRFNLSRRVVLLSGDEIRWRLREDDHHP